MNSLKNKTVTYAFHTALAFSLWLQLCFSMNALAQDEEIPSDTSSYPSSSSSSPNAKTTSKAKEDGELPPPVLPKAKEFSAAEMKKTCAKYEGKYILYYERIFKVEKCKRREYIIEEGTEPTKLRGAKILTVDSEIVAQLAQGEPLNGSKIPRSLSCNQLNGQYLLSRGEDIYFVEKCKRRLFPDFDTYTDHAKKRGKRNQDVLELDEAELAKIAEGEPIVSALDAEYKKLLDADTGIDVLPLAEACKGLNGKFVAYYSKIYRIEKCRKQPVDPQLFGRRYPRYEPTELNSDQWISIPTGTDYKL